MFRRIIEIVSYSCYLLCRCCAYYLKIYRGFASCVADFYRNLTPSHPSNNPNIPFFRFYLFYATFLLEGYSYLWPSPLPWWKKHPDRCEICMTCIVIKKKYWFYSEFKAIITWHKSYKFQPIKQFHVFLHV